MNSEELEISLRTEFESYLKGVFAEMRQEISQLQEKLDTELERHKSELDGVFSNVLNRVEPTRELDAGFKDTVMEHLRLAKDEGARITATAIAQAEELERKSAPTIGIKEIHEAISDISTKQSQSEILKSLVQQAGHFAPRGAFFIVKNEHLVGWRVFGNENASTDEKLREVFLPVSSNSILGEAVRSLETIKAGSASYSDDAEILNRLEFGEPQQMTAIPLIARGRGVAVLYADNAGGGAEVNSEALETLVRVAGLTVEVLASAKGPAGSKKDFVKKAAVAAEEYSSSATYQPETQYEAETVTTPSEVEQSYEESTYSAPVTEFQPETENVYGTQENQPEINDSYTSTIEPTAFYDPAPSIAPSVQDAPPPERDLEAEAVATEELPNDYVAENYQTNNYNVEERVAPETYQIEEIQPEEVYSADVQSNWSQPVETADYSAQEYAENFAKETDPNEYAKAFSYQAEEKQQEEPKEFSYDSPGVIEESFSNTAERYQEEIPVVEPTSDYQYEVPKTESFDTYETSSEPVEQFTPTPEQTYGSFEPQTEKREESSYSFEPVVNPPVQAEVPKSRFSDRNVDLPIEVSEDERRLHNDARRFARLLVSEIKLYNEQKVKEGRESGDLYDRLREAIDRSREMYDKRVQPAVAAKFDYFNYEIVNTLAEGDAGKLGAGYPGSNA